MEFTYPINTSPKGNNLLKRIYLTGICCAGNQNTWQQIKGSAQKEAASV
jgi:hypothetical protein